MLLTTAKQTVIATTGFLAGAMASFLAVNALEPESEGLFQTHYNYSFYLLDLSCGLVCAGIGVGLASWYSDYSLGRRLKQSDLLGIRSPLTQDGTNTDSRMPMMRS